MENAVRNPASVGGDREAGGAPGGNCSLRPRHSSIVRALGAGLPVRLVAAMHDTSTAMIERHYSGSISSMLDDMAGAAVVPLVGKREFFELVGPAEEEGVR